MGGMNIKVNHITAVAVIAVAEIIAIAPGGPGGM